MGGQPSTIDSGLGSWITSSRIHGIQPGFVQYGLDRLEIPDFGWYSADSACILSVAGIPPAWLSQAVPNWAKMHSPSPMAGPIMAHIS